MILWSCSPRGPSPRAWGELRDRRHPAHEWRTIPTRVGRTPDPCGRGCMRSDHPHAGGEHAGGVSSCGSTAGPSPRGWGERNVRATMSEFSRTIPTRVGRTRRSTSQSTNTSGPSPRGWGALVGPEPPHHRVRTIPTRVGRTHRGRATHDRRSDHPHAGGENTWDGRHDPLGLRTIPTRVGRTRRRAASRRAVSGPSPRGWGELTIGIFRNVSPTDHPHAGGENAA